MVAQDDGKKPEELESRPPTLADLVRLCAELNKRGAKYIVVGGMAMIEKGFTRATEDIDLLVDSSVANVAKVRDALLTLPDKAAADLAPSDVDEFAVVRIADELVVDLLKEACGVSFAEASASVELVEIEGIKIPFPNDEMLLKMKQGVREKDVIDRKFLLEKMKKA